MNDFSKNLPTAENFRIKRRHPSCCQRKISKSCKVFAIFVCSIVAIPIVGSIIAAIARCF